MKSDIIINRAKYAIGQTVRHTMLDYRGVIIDIDPRFENSAKWVQDASNITCKEQPWYQILVHDTSYMTYVAEKNLMADTSQEDIEHPVLELLFTKDEAGHYQRRMRLQ